MAKETTPLMDKVNGLIHHENVQRAQDAAAEKAKEVHTTFEEGSFSLRLLVQIGAVGLIVLAFEGLFANIKHFRLAKALMELFTLVLAYIIMTLESRLLALPKEWTQQLLKHAPFLKFVWGRGLLYFFAGTLQATQGAILDVVVGLYMMAVGAIFIILGYMTAQKLKSIGKRSISADSLKSKFDAVDKEKKGEIDLDQFSTLVDDFDFKLSRREKEIAFISLDKSDRGTLSFDEFKAWFQNVEEVAPIL